MGMIGVMMYVDCVRKMGILLSGRLGWAKWGNIGGWQ